MTRLIDAFLSRLRREMEADGIDVNSAVDVRAWLLLHYPARS